MKAPTKRPTGTHPEEQPRGAHPGTNTSSTGGCWKTLLLQTAPGGPGAEDTPQLPWDQMVLWVCRAASHIFPRDGQICHGQVPQNSATRSQKPASPSTSAAGALPSLRISQALQTFPPSLFSVIPIFWHCHYVNILTTHPHPLFQAGDARDTALPESPALCSKPGFFLQKSLLQNPWKRENVRPLHGTIKALVYWRQNTFCLINFGRGQMTSFSISLQIICS